MATEQVDSRNDKFLNYSKISYEDTLSQVSSILNLQTPRVQDFFNTSTGRMLHELFSAYTELIYRGIESGLLESYSPLATKLSSSIVDAEAKGYSIRRPVPAGASLYVILEGTVSHYSGSFTIKKKSSFSINSYPFIALDDYTFKWDATGRVTAPSTGAGIVQGSLKNATFTADEGKIFQYFEIADPTFSQYFGDADPLYDQIPENRITVVKVDGVAWEIDRRTLYNADQSTAPSMQGGKLVKSTNYKCMISTTPEGNIRILFGDGIISAIPSGNIEVTYLSTSGVAGNLYNSKDLKIDAQNVDIEAYPTNSINLDNISFYLNESAVGGADLESMDSIRYNSPKIFSALDRAVTTDDYKAILMTMPNVAHALAFGEDQMGAGDYRYFNTVMFTAINALYTGAVGSLRPSYPSEYILSGFNTLGVAQSIQDAGTTTSNLKATFDSRFTLSSIENDVSTQVRYEQYVNSLGSVFRLTKQNVDSTSEIGYILRTLRRKAQTTVRHIYFPSKVHKYTMKVEVFVTPISNKNTIASDIQQKTFSYLKDNTHFNFPVYESKIVKIIESLKSIVGCHVKFLPYAELPSDSKYLETLLGQSLSVVDDLFESLYKLQQLYPNVVLFPEFTSNGVLLKSMFTSKLFEVFGYPGSTLMNDSQMYEANVANFINYAWENTLGRMLLNPLIVGGKIKSVSDFLNTEFQKSIETGGLINTDFNELIYDTFIRWAVQFRNDTDYYTALYVISEDGDISNFTQPNEIAQIEIDVVNDITITTKNN